MAVFKIGALGNKSLHEASGSIFSSDKKFSLIWKEGDEVEYHGIYRCRGCGSEIALSQHYNKDNHTFPPHPSKCTGTVWELLVLSEGYKK